MQIYQPVKILRIAYIVQNIYMTGKKWEKQGLKKGLISAMISSKNPLRFL
jgi:hypothetical protein